VNQVGIILGPSLLGRFKILNVLFWIRGQEIIGTLSLFSFVLFLFVSAVKMDVGMVKRSGRKAMFTGVACILFPAVIGFLVEEQLGRLWRLNKQEAPKLPYLIVNYCITPFPVLVCLLEDLNILNSELGRLSLSAAMVSDLLGLFLSLVATFTKSGMEQGSKIASTNLGAFMSFVIVIVFAIRPASFWVIRQTPEGRPVKNTHIHTIMLILLGSMLFSRFFGQTVILGPFLLGLAIPDGPPLGSAIVKKLNFFVSDVFLPLYVTTCAMRVDLSLIKFDNSFMKINTVIIVLTFVAKMVACLVPSLYSKMPLNDALALALLLSCKGVIQLFNNTVSRDTEVTIFSPLFFFFFFLENVIFFLFSVPFWVPSI
jgi:Kef-type K+ transport system membrane component KefB